MKKAVILTGGKQYIVTEGQKLDVELLGEDEKVEFPALLVVDGDKVEIGKPETKVKVTAKVLEADKKDKKILVGKFKAKKRVKSLKGHRQHKSIIEITSIK
ncbi:MAG TPA: 50S ribosomal protein L21 [Candidatus Saccharibacteria bacterium]|jgi:large subunit ribosomal protein L21|nr:50S ribosomal protein L21 [Candidatus Saccharibacteria bacterium]